MRGLKLLDNKKIIELKSHSTNIISLGMNGEKYIKESEENAAKGKYLI